MATQPAASQSAFRSVMDLFKPKAVETASAGDPKTNGTVPNDGTLQSDGTGPKAIPKAATGNESPLDGYIKLWEHAESDGKPLQLVPPLTADPTKLLEAAKTVDFTKAMNPELLDKAAKGDAASLGQLVNEAAQAGYAQSALATTKILEAALTRQAAMFKDTVMPEILRRHSISQNVRVDNPIFDNPAVKPILEGLESQLAVKYPTSSATEISNHAKTILTAMSEDIIKQSGRQVVDAAGKDTTLGGGGTDFDWENHFLGKPQGS